LAPEIGRRLNETQMPYPSIKELPPAIRNHLPLQAQIMFAAAFNHAFDEYAERPDRESVAFRVAWAAVKRRYRKQGDMWVEK
jgi:cation transport regulator